jgi:hypothetical protein
MNERKILVWEPLYKGHYTLFLELIAKALFQSGWSVTVATDADSRVQLPSGIVRVNTDLQANPSDEPFRIARNLGIKHIFICYLDNALLPRKSHLFVGPSDPSVRVHGIWLHVSNVFRTGFFDYATEKSVRRSRLLVRRLNNLFDKKRFFSDLRTYRCLTVDKLGRS